MKTCKDCYIEKELDKFYGVQNECKECTKARVRKNYQKVGSKYDKTEKGVFRVIYKNQKRHNRLRGNGDISYSKAELIRWCYDSGFSEIYNKWKESGYKKDKKPSVDRVDDFKGYSFDNIRLGTWKDNRMHQYDDIKNGRGTSGRRCKPVNKFDEDMNLISTYVSYWSAVRDIGYSIEYQLKKNVKCRNGFYWQYNQPSTFIAP